MTVGAIVLAAGLSRRMGDDKLMADLGGRPVVEHVLAAVDAAGLEVVVAIPLRHGERDHPQDGGGVSAGSEPPSLQPPLHRLRRFPLPCRGAIKIEVSDHALGMGHSIAAAIVAVPPHWTAALICLGDMPFVSPATLSVLAGRAGAEGIWAPTYEGRRGNPVVWGRAFFPMLAQLTGDTGGRALLEDHADRLELVPVDDPGILIDIDTPEALAAARARLSGPVSSAAPDRP